MSTASRKTPAGSFAKMQLRRGSAPEAKPRAAKAGDLTAKLAALRAPEPPAPSLPTAPVPTPAPTPPPDLSAPSMPMAAAPPADAPSPAAVAPSLAEPAPHADTDLAVAAESPPAETLADTGPAAPIASEIAAAESTPPETIALAAAATAAHDLSPDVIDAPGSETTAAQEIALDAPSQAPEPIDLGAIEAPTPCEAASAEEPAPLTQPIVSEAVAAERQDLPPLIAATDSPDAVAFKSLPLAEPDPAVEPAPPAPAPAVEQRPAQTPPLPPLPAALSPALSPRLPPRPQPPAFADPGAYRRPAAPPPADIYAYWVRLRNGRRYPALADLDRGRVASAWPNTLLLSCPPESQRAAGDIQFIRAQKLASLASQANATSGIDFTPLLTDWVLSIGREVAKIGKPIEDTDTFPSMSGTVTYRAVVLPLSDYQREVDHVLCHVARI